MKALFSLAKSLNSGSDDEDQWRKISREVANYDFEVDIFARSIKYTSRKPLQVKVFQFLDLRKCETESTCYEWFM